MSDDPSSSGAEGSLGASVRSEPIKINDRRKFDKSGQRRADAPVEETPLGPPPASAASRPSGKDAGPASGASGAAGAKGERPAAGAPRSGPSGREASGAVDFQSFVYFLYMSALHELGVPAEPGAPARPADLERARFFVEVLQVIEEKTKGNLSPGETRLLEEALYNLRMQYVGVSRTGPA